MQKTPKAIILLYVLLGYVVAQFAWWGYLIYDLNVDLSAASASDVSGSLNRKLWMILGEGSVFIFLLMTGAFYIRKFILREHRLTRQERNFLLATTHEFNSPIAAIKLNLQTLKKHEMDTNKRSLVVDGALSSAQRLESLVSNLLLASRLDVGKLELYLEAVEVKPLLQQVASRYAQISKESGNTLELHCTDGIVLQADRVAMETIVGNLVENALKYAPNTKVIIEALEDENEVLISVSDGGSGIAEDEKTQVFKKFYRVTNEETRNQKGSGLGLFLVKELVELHRGSIEIESVRPSGVRFAIRIDKTQL